MQYGLPNDVYNIAPRLHVEKQAPHDHVARGEKLNTANLGRYVYIVCNMSF
jgi:hypothetical protein